MQQIAILFDDIQLDRLEKAFPGKPLALIIESGLSLLMEKVKDMQRPTASLLIDYDKAEEAI
jgi:hypothetical protein